MHHDGPGFFDRGFYKKPRACPRVFDVENKWSIPASIDRCNIPASKRTPVIVEEKFNGNRGMFEFDGIDGCLSSAKKRCHDKGFPSKVNVLLSSILREKGINDAVLDGEMYLESCGGRVPGMNKQARAIKGKHDDLERDCSFSYKVYDVIRLNGKNVSRSSQARRKALLKSVLPERADAGNVSVEPVHGTLATLSDEIARVAASIIARGGEGIVVKSPSSRYAWMGKDEKHPSTDGWWKVKNSSVIDAEATIACLGNPGKTGLNAFRYVSFQLGACKDASCDELVPITDKGVSHSATGGDASGHDRWNATLHDAVVTMLKRGEAKPAGTFRDVATIVTETGKSPSSFSRLVQGHASALGIPGLPRCAVLPRGALVLSVAGLEFNVDKHGIPRINGPPVIVAVNKARSAWTVDDILSLPSVHA